MSRKNMHGIRMGRRTTVQEKRRAYRDFWVEMMPHVGNVVVESFVSQESGMRNPTMAEVKERTEFCKRLVDELRNDFQWSAQRIRDNLGVVLRAKLAGIELPLEKMAQRITW